MFAKVIRDDTFSDDCGHKLALEKQELSEILTIPPLQCRACSKRPKFLRILSVNVILTSIKDHNSLTNLRKSNANNSNVDIVSINSYIKFGQNLFIGSKDIEWKQKFGVNQGPKLWYKCAKNDV